MAVCVSGVQLVEGDLPAVYNWDTTIDNIASGYTPVQSLSIGNRDTFLGYGVTSLSFELTRMQMFILTEKYQLTE